MAAARLFSPTGPPANLSMIVAQQPAIGLVEAVRVHLEQLQRVVADRAGDAPVGAHLREVADAAQQPVGDARRAARPARDLARRLRRDLHAQNARRPRDDLGEIGLVVEVEAVHDAEPRSQRRRQQPRARRRANQRERLHRQLDRPRARPLADHDVDLEVLHRRVEDFLDRRTHAVDFVDEQHVARLQVGEDRREVARLLEHGTGRRPHRDAQLVADDVRERRLAESGRAEEQHVIERLAALPRGRDRHVEIRAHALLADVVVERAAAAARLRTGRRRPAGTR